jgi:hypothetical protein
VHAPVWRNARAYGSGTLESVAARSVSDAWAVRHRSPRRVWRGDRLGITADRALEREALVRRREPGDQRSAHGRRCNVTTRRVGRRLGRTGPALCGSADAALGREALVAGDADGSGS